MSNIAIQLCSNSLRSDIMYYNSIHSDTSYIASYTYSKCYYIVSYICTMYSVSTMPLHCIAILLYM